MFEALGYAFFQNAIIAALLISVACGIIGPLIMINRLFSLAGGITHGAFGGIGVAIYFALPMLLTISVWTLGLVFIVAFLSRAYPHRSDNIIAVLWAFGMAVGLILIDLTSGYKSDLMAYLFGSILAVSSDDLWLMAIIDIAFIALVVGFYRQFEIISFDSEFATLKGVPTSFFYYLLLCMIALCIIIGIRAVGLILIIALLSIPCFIAEHFTKRLGSMMALSCALSGIFCLLGLILSYYFSLTSGASIILVASVGFGVFMIARFRR